MSSSLLESAGFSLPGSESPPAPASVVRKAGSGSLLESAGFSLPSATPASAPAAPAWQDQEAQQNLAAIGYQAPPPPPGRGVAQALRDYPGVLWHRLLGVPQGVVDTLAAPGTVLASKTPSTSESLIPPALGLAGVEAMLPTGAVGAATGAAVAAKAGPTAQAVNRMVEAIGPENVPAAVERLKSNPRLAVADVSDPVRTMTQGLIDPAQPAAQNAIVDAVKTRAAGATNATNEAYSATLGPTPNVIKTVEALKERARAAGREAIQPALENSRLVDTSPVIAAIDEKLAPGVNPLLNPKSELPLSPLQEELARFKQQLLAGNGEQLFDPKRLHEIQSNMGDYAYQLSRSPDPKDRYLAGQLRDINEKLIDQIDDASAGAYRPARQKFADAKDISEAFEAGFETLKNRQGLAGALADSPQALKEWIAKASPEEIMARKLGTRADIDQQINAAKNGALKGETIVRPVYNQQKLRMLYGDAEANRLITAMNDAHDQAITNAKLLANSKTAETLAGQKALAVPEVGKGNPLQYVAPFGMEALAEAQGLSGAGFAAWAAGKGIQLGVQKAMQVNALARNEQFARAAMATGPERNILLERLMAHPKVRAAAGQ